MVNIMKIVLKALSLSLIIIILSVSVFGAGAVEITPGNHQKQFKNSSAVKFKNSAQLLDLPSKYSSKDSGYCTSVKQQYGETCWAFASISTYESALLRNHLFSSDLSVDALDKWGSTRDNGEGWIRDKLDPGTTLISMGYFTSRNGPVENDSDTVKTSANAISYYEKGDNNLIKLAIMRTGAVTSSYISDNYGYSKNRTSYCITDEIESSNGHSVSVVGWDDNYSKENFDGNYTPKNDGAWLCKNSQGPYSNSIGGYVWISYEDYYLFNNDWFDPSFAIEKLKTISGNENLYQNEEYGATYSFSIPDATDTTYFNVFDFSKDGNCLDKIVFETTSLGAKYSVYYTPVDEKGAPINDRSKWQLIKKDTVNYNGYICVDAENTVIPDKKGAIAVEINTDVAKYKINNNIGVSEWLRESGSGIMRFQSTCKNGESFVTFKDQIVDVRDYYIKEMDDYIGGTLVIKAITNKKVNTDIKGDVNYDEKVNITDATLIQKHLAKINTLQYHKLTNADFNGDGKVNINDTTAIQKYIAKSE